MAKYTYKDIFDPSLDAGIDKLHKKLQGMDATLKKMGRTGSGKQATQIEKMKVATQSYTKEIKGLNAQSTKLAKLEREKASAQKKAIKIQERANREADKLNIERQKQIQNERLLKKEISDRAKALAQLKRAQKGSKEQIQANNRLLSMQRDKLEIGSKKYQAFSRAILKNENKLKSHDKAVGRNQRNVGNYPKTVDFANKSVNRFSKGVQNARASLLKLSMAIGAGIMIAQRLWQGVQKSIKAYQVQERAVNQSREIFGAYSEQLQKSAADIQKVTTTGDEQTIALQNQAGSMGVAINKVDEATRGAIGLAQSFEKAGLGQETALKGIALAYQGNFSQLERYIPALRAAETEAEKMAILQEEMAKGFDLATAAALDSGGQMQQLENTYGDLQEQIGELLIPTLTFLAGKAKEVVGEFSDFLKDIKAISNYISGIAAPIIEKFSGILDNKLFKAFKALISPITALWQGIKLIVGAIADMTGETKSAVEQQLEAWRETGIGVDEAAKRLAEYEKQYRAFKLVGKNDPFVTNFEEQKKAQEANIEALKKYISELGGVQKAIVEKEKTDTKAKNTALENLKAEQELALKLFEQRALQRELNNERFINEELYKKQFVISQHKELLQFVKDNATDLTEAEVAGLNNTILALQIKINDLKKEMGTVPGMAGFENGQFTGTSKPGIERQADNIPSQPKFDLGDFGSSVIGGEGSSYIAKMFSMSPEEEEGLKEGIAQLSQMIGSQLDSLFKNRLSAYDAELKAIDEVISKEEERLDQALRANELKEKAGAAFSTAEVQRAQDRLKAERDKEAKLRREREKTAKLQKGIDLSKAIATTALSVVKAFTNPPPLSFIMAAIAAGVGAGSIAKIKATKYAKGTEFVDNPDAPDGIDTVPAMLTKGEKVVSVEHSKGIPRTFPNAKLADAVQTYLALGGLKNESDLAELQQQTGLLKKIVDKEEITRDAKGRIIVIKRGNVTNIYS